MAFQDWDSLSYSEQVIQVRTPVELSITDDKIGQLGQ